MSYRRANESATTGGPAPVTVCTNDLALVDLPQNRGPFACSESCRDAELLVSQVIELEDDGVALSAVDAWAGAKELDEESHPLENENVFAAVRFGDVALAVGQIVLAFVRGTAGSAVGVPLASLAAMPREQRNRLVLATSRAPLCA